MKMDYETQWVFDEIQQSAEELAVWVKDVRTQAELALSFHEMPSLKDAAIAKGLQEELSECGIRMQQCIDAVDDSIEMHKREVASDEATETN